jgi:hypothetical protein
MQMYAKQWPSTCGAQIYNRVDKTYRAEILLQFMRLDGDLEKIVRSFGICGNMENSK